MSLKENFLVRFIIDHLPRKNIIILESLPDLSDNTKAVFDEMIRRGMNKKYKFIWRVKNPDKNLPKIDNVVYLPETSMLRMRLYKIFSKCLICCNEALRSIRKGQVCFYLSHGTPIKSVRNYYKLPKGIDHCLAAGEGVVTLCSYEFSFSSENFFALGFPRNDALTNSKCDLKPLFPDVDFDKILVWYPTYRQHKCGLSTASANALPIINDGEKAKKLNEFAKENRLLLVLKPHFVQDLSYIRNLHLSNIVFIDDSFFVKNNISSYEFVGNCDALVTDYSSIYYDYTLCDKPIALIWEDYEDYKRFPGFAPGAEELMGGGEKVYNLEEFVQFLKRVVEGKDVLREKRNEICKKVNCSTDGKNSERVVDFIIEKAGL